MTTYSTPKVGFVRPVPGTNQPHSTTQENQNWETLDTKLDQVDQHLVALDAQGERLDALQDQVDGAGSDLGEIAGVLPVAKGGTGSTTAAGALTNLGAVDTSDSRLSDARTPKAHTHYQLVSGSTNLNVGEDSSGDRVWSMAIRNRQYEDIGIANPATKLVVITDAGTLGVFTGGDKVLYLGGTTLTTTAPFYNPYARSHPVTSSYVGAWLNGDGRLGASASSIRFKQDVKDWSPDLQAVLALRLVQFRYKEQVERLGPDAPVEFGVIAEELVELGLDAWVFFDEDGQPQGVHYERLCLAMLPVLQNHEERLLALEGK